ncbi:hypothetical protein BJ508DRAFT_305795 [Ascobolus immersus RN42]|uniref:Uncharacterized protein n=1 Tax=Ascobolus immersus RN42 TaxID=1160509 RepID=A0A3N4I8J1_ASCIM|nr:hypothetical protein BJ508DRAFT_305795 [Ascobolus immersus RN42]
MLVRPSGLSHSFGAGFSSRSATAFSYTTSYPTFQRSLSEETITSYSGKRKRKSPTMAKKKAKANNGSHQTAEPWHYVGKRLIPREFIPIDDKEVRKVYAENPRPHIPFTKEIDQAIDQLEEEWILEQQQQSRAAQSGGTGTGNGGPGGTPTSANRRQSSGAGITPHRQSGIGTPGSSQRTPSNSQQQDTQQRVDGEHPIYQYCIREINDARSSLKAKVLKKAHLLYAAPFMKSTAGWESYNKKLAGLGQYAVDPMTGFHKPYIPDPKLFPSHYDSIATAQAIYADIADGIDWDGLFKGGDQKQGLNFMGRAVVAKAISLIQAECVNGLAWCDAKGVYNHPLVKVEGQPPKPAVFHRSNEVQKLVRATDIRVRPKIKDPREVERRIQCDMEEIIYDKDKPIAEWAIFTLFRNSSLPFAAPRS